jgi:hypothetical protein
LIRDSFIHGIDPSNWLACWNLTLKPRLESADYLALLDPGLQELHQPIRDYPLERIEAGELPVGVFTPRTLEALIEGEIVLASVLTKRNGLQKISSWKSEGSMILNWSLSVVAETSLLKPQVDMVVCGLQKTRTEGKNTSRICFQMPAFLKLAYPECSGSLNVILDGSMVTS